MYLDKENVENKVHVKMENMDVKINKKAYTFNAVFVMSGLNPEYNLIDIKMVNIEISDEMVKDGIKPTEELDAQLSRAAIPYVKSCYEDLMLEYISQN